MAQIKKNPLSFWLYVIKHSFIAIFDSEETRGSFLKSVVSWTISVIAGLSVIATLGWIGWLKGIGNNALTYLATLISSLVLRFVTNLITTPSNLYFMARRDADKLNWGDVKSSVWREPQEKSIMVGVKLERDEPHSVQYLRAILRSVVKDGQIWFKGD